MPPFQGCKGAMGQPGGCPRIEVVRWVSPNDANDGAVQLGGCPRIEVGTTRPTDAGSKWWVSPNEGSRRQNEGSFGGCPRFPDFRGCPRISGCPRIEVGTTRPTDAGSKWWVSPISTRSKWWVSPNAGGCPQMTLSVTRHLLQAVFARRQKKTIGFGRQCLHDPLLIR